MVGFMGYFSDISDPRSKRNQRHDLEMLIGTTLLAAMSGIDSFSGIAEFVEAHEESLSEYFSFSCGVPSHDTYQRLWDGISPIEFANSFHKFTASLEKKFASHIVSIDGKAIRNSGCGSALHAVSAWCESNALVLAHRKVDGKSNEITAVPELLKLLDLTDCVVTLDAMGAQRNICQDIIDKDADYLISLKGNQGRLHQEVKEFFVDPEGINSCDRFSEEDKGHGRLETRTAYVTSDISWLQEEHKWPGLRTIVMIHSTVKRGDKKTEETRFYISSAPANAHAMCQAVRAHWSIENKLHWRMDVVLNEDKACIRNDNAAENMSIVRKWTINALSTAKEKPDQSLKSIMRKNSMSFKYLKKTIKKIFHA